ncbi:hypothetical protein LTSESEN_4960, partial [Salmonella enterica subsp. enterica serovar Senftenberg str. A4-543]
MRLAVSHQIFNRDYRHIMLACKRDTLRRARY